MQETRQAVQDGKIVALRYALRNQHNEVIEDITDLPPIRYRHGSAGIQQSLQEAVTGLYAGDQRIIILSPANAPELDQIFHLTVIIDEVSDTDPDADTALGGPITNQFPTLICDQDCDCFLPRWSSE